jgi:recombination associated protein RdgC
MHLTSEALSDKLEKHAFQPGGSRDMQSLEWVAPRDDSGFVYALDGHYLMCLRVEKKLLPATVINQAAKARDIDEQQGFKPGRKQMKDIKEQVTDDLLPKSHTVYHDTRLWMDTRDKWLVIDTSTDSKSDEVLGMLAKCLEPFPVTPLYVEQSPAAAMTNWLITDEPPSSFSIDQDTELRSTAKAAQLFATSDKESR